ncbi:TPA: hypothetical protein QCY19_004897 [Bacillus luti]|nr:hypothetical protein [Bacillus luti]HDR7796159.1 hypothetical protein [Bacillus luti]
MRDEGYISTYKSLYAPYSEEILVGIAQGTGVDVQKAVTSVKHVMNKTSAYDRAMILEKVTQKMSERRIAKEAAQPIYV